jgi:TRAP-type C4-dicarboxylate transport system substrate-binding protein
MDAGWNRVRRRRPGPVLVALALAALGWGRTAAAQEVVVKLATLVPKDSSWHRTLQEWANEWKRQSHGAVRLRIYPGGVAGDDTDVVRKMRLGVLGAGLLTAGGLADIDRSVLALAVPMAYESYAEFDRVLEGMTPLLEQALAAKGFVLLNWADAGWLHFFSRSPVRTPDDLRKLKLFTGTGDQPTVDLWIAAGFRPVPLPATEISTALQTGLVTAVAATPKAAVLLGWYRRARYMSGLKWAVLLAGTVVRSDLWERVPEAIRPALIESARRAGRKLSAQTRADAPHDVAAMVRHGLVEVTVDHDTRDLWRRAAHAAYPALRDAFAPAAAIDAAIELRDRFRRDETGASGQ